MQSNFNTRLKPQTGFVIFSIYIALALSTVLVFRQVGKFDFVNYDDTDYVSENQHVLNGLTSDGVRWAFTTGHAYFWHPLTWLSLMLDCQLFGPDPGWIHLVSVFLHLANTLLVFAVLKKMTGSIWPSAFVAAAFAIHPMHVESVVWISERKDVLSTFFFLLTLASYAGYVKRPSVFRYFATLTIFAVGLMAKPMLVTLPFLLLLLDYWPLNRFEAPGPVKISGRQTHESTTAPGRHAALCRIIIEKIPFLVFSAVFSVITFLTQQAGGVIVDIKTIPLKLRAGNVFFSYAAYIGKMFWPKNLAAHYPFEAVGAIPLGQFVLYALLLVSVSLLVLRFWRTRRYLLVGWFWFVGTLIPVIGLVKFTVTSYADRFTYIPYIGLFIMIAWGLPELLSKLPYRKAVLGISMMIVLMAFGICSHRQVSFWNNSISLFSHALEVTQNNYLAYNNLGAAYETLGRYQDAIDAYKQAIGIKPDYADACYNLGIAYGNLGRYQEAIEAYRQAIGIKPDNADAYNNLGVAYYSLGRYQEAIEVFKQAIRIKPDNADAYNNLGAAYGRLGRYQEAIEAYKQAIGIKPDNADAHNNIGTAYYNLGRYQEAMEAYKQAIRIKADFADAHNNLGAAYGSLGRYQEAIEAFKQAIGIKPDFADAHNNLGVAYLNIRDKASAMEEYKILKTLDAEMAKKLFNMINNAFPK
jgi:tetratricopeptide (TPR) repeat protein